MRVKIGMNMLLWGTHITPEHIPVFAALAAAGFDGVEIPVGGQSTVELKAMASACDDLGLARTAVAFVPPHANPISPDPGVRAAAVDNLRNSIDAAALIGADLLGGALYQAHKYFTGKAATGQEWQWCADYLRTCGAHAQQRGMRLSLEFLNRFEVFLINTSAECARMVRDVGLPNVGVHYDTHHANIEDPHPGEALPGIRHAVNHVHLSESHRGALGTGQVDWDATFAALRDIDYEGWLVIEAFGTADPVLATAANVWRNAFESPEALYRDGIAFIRARL